MPRPSLSSLSFPLAYLVVLSAFAVVHALPSPSPVSSSLALFQRRADPGPQPCGFDGDDNTYGLGIRLGIYIQWLTTTLCYFLGPSKSEGTKNMKGINLSFQAAVFGGLLYVTITRGNTQEAGQLYAAEVWVMLNLCLVGGILTVGPEPGERTFAINHVFQNALNVAIISYAVWFVFTGMDQMAHPPCSIYMFSFAKVDMYRNSFRLLWKMTAIFAAIFAIFCLFMCIVRLLNSESVEAVVPTDGILSLVGSISRFFGLGVLVASTELTIRWNHIHNVNSVGGTGQLISLIVACLGFIRLVYKLFPELRQNWSLPQKGWIPTRAKDR